MTPEYSPEQVLASKLWDEESVDYERYAKRARELIHALWRHGWEIVPKSRRSPPEPFAHRFEEIERRLCRLETGFFGEENPQDRPPGVH